MSKIEDYVKLRYSPEVIQLKDYELAKEIGCSERAIAYWNAGERVPNGSVLSALRLYIDKCRLQAKLDEAYDYYR